MGITWNSREKKNQHIVGQNTSVIFRCTSHCYQDTSVFVRNKLRLKFSLNKTVTGSGTRKYIDNIISLFN